MYIYSVLSTMKRETYFRFFIRNSVILCIFANRQPQKRLIQSRILFLTAFSKAFG